MVFAVILGLLAVSVYFLTGASHRMAPTDDNLIRKFQAHRAEFERLRKMAAEDMHQMPSFSEASISLALPESRRSEYKQLLRLSQALIVGTNYDGSTRFILASDEHTAIGPGWSKGIQFIPAEAKLIGIRAANLDEAEKLAAGVYLREIEPQWFVFYQRDD
jgi:hypothetical protein